MNHHIKRIIFMTGVGLLMALQPFGAPAHLPQKWELLKNGYLYGIADWFDLILHSGLLVIAAGYTIWYFVALILAAENNQGPAQGQKE